MIITWTFIIITPQLDEEGLKEKKKQKLIKAGFEARARARREKEKAQEERAAEERKEDEERAANPSAWVARVRGEHASVMERVKERNRRKAALGDRKSAAAQARMKNIASLAADERVGKKRRKGGGGTYSRCDFSCTILHDTRFRGYVRRRR